VEHHRRCGFFGRSLIMIAHAYRIAKTAGVGMLVLTHMIPTDGGPSAEVGTEEAKRDFDGEVVLGEDFMEF